jgi:hypothetical protein
MSEYRTPQAFRAALEARQRKRAAAEDLPFDRVAQVDLYFRFLERVLQDMHGVVVVKGGVALEMRLRRARTTGDIDLRALGNPADVLEKLRQAGRRDHGDYLMFEVNERAGAEAIAGEGVVYEGRRFRATARFAGKPYRQSFGLDVAFDDPMVGEPDHITAPDALSFAGIAPPIIPIYPLGTHLAEKLHAYTLPRESVNGRMKDLIDIALVAAEPALRPVSMTIRASIVRTALEKTFAFRNSHPLPSACPPWPTPWAARYPREKELNALPWASIDDVHAEAARFLDPVLAETAFGVWDPASRACADRIPDERLTSRDSA